MGWHEKTTGERFLRRLQRKDADGWVQFETIFPDRYVVLQEGGANGLLLDVQPNKNDSERLKRPPGIGVQRA